MSNLGFSTLAESLRADVSEAVLRSHCIGTPEPVFLAGWQQSEDRLLRCDGVIGSVLDRLEAERDAALNKVASYERSFEQERDRWRNDDEFRSLDTLRRSLAGPRPGDAELIARTQSRLAQAETGIVGGRGPDGTVGARSLEKLRDDLDRVSALLEPQRASDTMDEARTAILALAAALRATEEQRDQARSTARHTERAYVAAIHELEARDSEIRELRTSLSRYQESAWCEEKLGWSQPAQEDPK